MPRLRPNRALYAPATMAIAGVVMNGAVIPEAEFKPQKWVGKPVTLGHPTDAQGFRAAVDSDAVGVIMDAWVQDGRLKATLKLDDKKLPAHVRRLIENESPLDVSTGYFSVDVPAGDLMLNVDLIPDHLALLPGEEGACSWRDGCGLRAQTRGKRTLRVNNCCTECQTMSKRNELIERVVANTAITRAQAHRLSSRDLEVVANGALPDPRFLHVLGMERLPEFTGRVESVTLADEDDPEVVAMTFHEELHRELHHARSARRRAGHGFGRLTANQIDELEEDTRQRRARAVTLRERQETDALIMRGLLTPTRPAPPHEQALASEYKTGQRRVSFSDLTGFLLRELDRSRDVGA